MATMSRKRIAWQPPPARLEGDRLLKEAVAAAAGRRFKTVGEMIEEQRANAPKAYVSPVPGISPEPPDYVPSDLGALREKLSEVAKDVEEIKHRPTIGGAVMHRPRVSEASVRNAVLIDEDDFASNSDQEAPTQQSTKAYVDGAIADRATLKYADRAAVAATTVPADTDNIVIDAYSSSAPSAGRANYKAATLAEYNATPSALRLTDANGRRFVINETRLSPDMAGGDPLGVNDSSAALNAIFAALRTEALASGSQLTVARAIDLTGGKWRVTSPINATKIVAWNWTIEGGLLIGACEGKPILDLCGSRGYQIQGTGFYGELDAMPSCAWQVARTTEAGYGNADMASYQDVSTTGWFSEAAARTYGHETIKFDHCTIFNYNPEGRTAIMEGYDAHPFTSDFVTVRTGGQSNIQVLVSNCDFRYLPQSGYDLAVVTGVTNAASGVFTVSGTNPFEIGDEVCFYLIGGMSGLDTLVGEVTAVTSTTVTTDVDTTSLGTYTSGGILVRRQSNPSVYLARASQMNWHNSYIVAFGRPPLELGFPESGYRKFTQLTLDNLYEGAGFDHNVEFSTGGAACSIKGFRYTTYASRAGVSEFGTNGGGVTTITDGFTESLDPVAVVPLVDDATKFLGLDSAYTPSVVATSGTITTVGATDCTVRYVARMVFVQIDITITTNGTGEGGISVSLPFTPARNAVIYGKEQTVSGKALTGQITAGTPSMFIKAADNLYPGANGARMVLEGWVERA